MSILVRIFLAARLYLLLISPGLFVTGAGANQAVLWANHGKFPVMLNEVAKKEFSLAGEFFHLPDGYIDDIHCVMTRHTHLNWLADYINLRGLGIFSPGDMLITASESSSSFLTGCWFALVASTLYGHYSRPLKIN